MFTGAVGIEEATRELARVVEPGGRVHLREGS
jgi:ubiquinone/menaquinone biosynthesis C-methylase UbiE